MFDALTCKSIFKNSNNANKQGIRFDKVDYQEIENYSQRKLINVSLLPGGHWKQAILGLDSFNIFSHDLDEDILDMFIKPAAATKPRGRAKSSLIVPMLLNPLDSAFPHL